MTKRITIAALAATTALALLAGEARAQNRKQPKPPKGPWTTTVESPRPDRRGKPQSPAIGYFWMPPQCKQVRGILLGGKIIIEGKMAASPIIREALTEKNMAVLYFQPHIDATFVYTKSNCGERLQKALDALAAKTGHPEIARVPWLTMGHSTAGIYARNVAYWKPSRVMGVIHIKSGNFQDGIPDTSRSLAGVPFLAINGEFEEYGPKGGDLGVGLRKKYSLHPDNKKKLNQTQWVMIRMQILDRRRKNPDNLMGLVVHRGNSHTTWDDDMNRICAQFIRSCADARLPDKIPAGNKPIACKPMKAADGWLADPDIKAPKHKPAPYADYTCNKTRAFWYIDKATALAVYNYHQAKKWSQPDPTAGLPDQERYTPPAMLQDKVDVPAAPASQPKK